MAAPGKTGRTRGWLAERQIRSLHHPPRKHGSQQQPNARNFPKSINSFSARF
jgi:hypothetical protein